MPFFLVLFQRKKRTGRREEEEGNTERKSRSPPSLPVPLSAIYRNEDYMVPIILDYGYFTVITGRENNTFYKTLPSLYFMLHVKNCSSKFDYKPEFQNY